MSGSRAAAAPARVLSVDRSLGMLMSLSAVVLLIGEWSRFSAEVGSFALWWNVGGGAMVLLILTAAVGGTRLPERLLMGVWTSVVVLVCVLELSVFLAYQGSDPDRLFPWVWRFDSIAVCYLVLLAPRPAALAAPFVVSFLPALSGALFLGRVPEVVAAQTPLHLGNIMFVVLFLAMRSRLGALSRAEQDVRSEEARRAMLDAHARREEQFARVVHDELLSVLSAALHTRGHTPEVLRREARRSRERLHEALIVAEDDALTPGRAVRQRIMDVVRDALPHARIDEDGDDAPVATRGADAVRAALAEAARNTARHAAGAPATLVVRVHAGAVDASLSDEGPGFDLDAVPAERLGVRHSILGRMQELPGGYARVLASRSGTRVDVGWRP